MQRLLGGLAPDNDEPMSDDMREMIQRSWHRIEQNIPGVKFNFDFWEKCQPRRSTYASCRAVIAARQQGDKYDVAMTSAIQRAYYQEARNPSNDDTLIALASEIGLNTETFKNDFYSDGTKQTLMNEIEDAHAMHADSFPSLVLQEGSCIWPVPIDYNHVVPMLETITMIRARQPS